MGGGTGLPPTHTHTDLGSPGGPLLIEDYDGGGRFRRRRCKCLCFVFVAAGVDGGRRCGGESGLHPVGRGAAVVLVVMCG